VGAEVLQTLAVGCSMSVSGNTTLVPGTADDNTVVQLVMAGGRSGCGVQGLVDPGYYSKEGAHDGSTALATCSMGQALERWPQPEPEEGAGSGTTLAGHGPPLSPLHCASGKWGFPHRATVLLCAPVRVGVPPVPAG
jgi:hypothetical protein